MVQHRHALRRGFAALLPVALAPVALALLALALLALALVATPRAGARMFDEFEVHGTDIAPPGMPTADLFLNYGVRGLRNPASHGALATDRATYLSPLLGAGLTSGWETAVILPMAIDQGGQYRAGGAKLHNVLVLPPDPAAAWSFGIVLEASALSRRFQPATFGWEARPLAQYQRGPWTGHLTLGFAGTVGRGGEAILAPAASLLWAANERLAIGLEHYAELGPVGHPAPLARQAHQLFGVVELPVGPFALNLGLGRGLTTVTDRWVAKSQLAYEF